MAEKDTIAIQEIKETTIEIKGLIDKFVETNELKFKMYEEKLKVANHRIDDLEETNKWLWRAIAGTLISTVIAFLIKIKL